MRLQENNIIGVNYQIIQRIGAGSFGQIYQAKNLLTNTEVAIKTEENATRAPQLLTEKHIIESLQYEDGFTAIHDYGRESDISYMIIDILGPNLEELFQYCGRRFSLRTTCMVMIQLIKRFSRIHAHNFIHRDIKPENFLLGLTTKSGLVHVVDYGLSKRFYSTQQHQHIPHRKDKGLVGTARYASIHAHLGEELSRRDDMEAIGNVLIYFFKGSLPWQNLQGITNSEKHRKITEVKCGISLEELCEGCPGEFKEYMRHCRELQFEDKPNYSYLEELFIKICSKEGYDVHDHQQFDWVLRLQDISARDIFNKKSKNNQILHTDHQDIKDLAKNIKHQQLDNDDEEIEQFDINKDQTIQVMNVVRGDQRFNDSKENKEEFKIYANGFPEDQRNPYTPPNIFSFENYDHVIRTIKLELFYQRQSMQIGNNILQKQLNRKSGQNQDRLEQIAFQEEKAKLKQECIAMMREKPKKKVSNKHQNKISEIETIRGASPGLQIQQRLKIGETKNLPNINSCIEMMVFEESLNNVEKNLNLVKHISPQPPSSNHHIAQGINLKELKVLTMPLPKKSRQDVSSSFGEVSISDQDEDMNSINFDEKSFRVNPSKFQYNQQRGRVVIDTEIINQEDEDKAFQNGVSMDLHMSDGDSFLKVEKINNLQNNQIPLIKSELNCNLSQITNQQNQLNSLTQNKNVKKSQFIDKFQNKTFSDEGQLKMRELEKINFHYQSIEKQYRNLELQLHQQNRTKSGPLRISINFNEDSDFSSSSSDQKDFDDPFKLLPEHNNAVDQINYGDNRMKKVTLSFQENNNQKIRDQSQAKSLQMSQIPVIIPRSISISPDNSKNCFQDALRNQNFTSNQNNLVIRKFGAQNNRMISKAAGINNQQVNTNTFKSYDNKQEINRIENSQLFGECIKGQVNSQKTDPQKQIDNNQENLIQDIFEQAKNNSPLEQNSKFKETQEKKFLPDHPKTKKFRPQQKPFNQDIIQEELKYNEENLKKHQNGIVFVNSSSSCSSFSSSELSSQKNSFIQNSILQLQKEEIQVQQQKLSDRDILKEEIKQYLQSEKRAIPQFQIQRYNSIQPQVKTFKQRDASESDEEEGDFSKYRNEQFEEIRDIDLNINSGIDNVRENNRFRIIKKKASIDFKSKSDIIKKEILTLEQPEDTLNRDDPTRLKNSKKTSLKQFNRSVTSINSGKLKDKEDKNQNCNIY